jgi:hypothetical protein
MTEKEVTITHGHTKWFYKAKQYSWRKSAPQPSLIMQKKWPYVPLIRLLCKFHVTAS